MSSKGSSDKVGENSDDTGKKDFKDSKVEGKKGVAPSDPPITGEDVIKRMRSEGKKI